MLTRIRRAAVVATAVATVVTMFASTAWADPTVAGGDGGGGTGSAQVNTQIRGSGNQGKTIIPLPAQTQLGSGGSGSGGNGDAAAIQDPCYYVQYPITDSAVAALALADVGAPPAGATVVTAQNCPSPGGVGFVSHYSYGGTAAAPVLPPPPPDVLAATVRNSMTFRRQRRRHRICRTTSTSRSGCR